MNRNLLFLLLLASCKATTPGTSGQDHAHSNLAPGAAIADIIIIDYTDKTEFIDAVARVKKAYKYGANTSPLGRNDTLSLHISGQLFQASEQQEKEFMDHLHAGKSMRMLIKEIRSPRVTDTPDKYKTWKVIKIE